MEKNYEFKVGQKVKIPKRKTADCRFHTLEECSLIINLPENQDYVFITVINEYEVVLGVSPEKRNSTFHISDIEPYEEEFVLPKKWGVKDCTEVTEYGSKRFKHSSLCPLEGRWLYVNESIPNYWYETDENRKDYTEITFQQFQKHILKQETMKKEIIGYKLIKPEYNKAVLNLIGEKELPLYEDNTHLHTNTIAEKILKEAGVLDIWFEPIISEKLPILLGFEGKEVETSIQYGCKKFLKEDCKQLIKYLNIFEINSFCIKEGEIFTKDLNNIKNFC